MPLTIEEIYSIKCTIGRSLFLGRFDWEERIGVNVETCRGAANAYIRFRTTDAIVSLDNNGMIYVVCVGGRKTIKFKHQNIGETTERIGAELSAHVSGSI
jgi:hypothetical protein